MVGFHRGGRVCMAIVILILCPGRAAVAQRSGIVTGTVDDDTKAPLVGVTIVLAPAGGGPSRETVTDRAGHFEITGVMTGMYKISASLDGFQTAGLQVTIGADAQLPPLAIRLKVSNVEQGVTVVGRKAGDPLSPDSNADAVTIDEDRIRWMPSESQDLLPTLTDFMSPLAAASGVSVVIDGVEEGHSLSIPASAIRRLTINRNPYSAQFRGAGKARIDVVTDRGSRRLVHGSAAMFTRNSALDARNAFAVTTPDLDRRLGEATLSGPVPGTEYGYSYYFTGLRLINNDSAVVNALQVGGPLVKNVPAPERRTQLLGGFDWRKARRYDVNVRYSYFDSGATSEGVGGLHLADQAYGTTDRIHQLVLGNHMLFSDTFVNDLRFTFLHDEMHEGGPAAGPQTIVEGAFTAGPSQVFTSMRSPSMRAQEIATFVRGRHTIALGGTFRAKVVHVSDASNFGGTFTFGDLTQFQHGAPFLYAVNVGSPSVTFTNHIGSGYVEDNIRLGAHVSMTAGVRDDWERRLGHTWGPRFSIAFAPGNQKTVLRAGAGLFSEYLPSGVITRTELRDGVRIRELVVRDPSFPEVSQADLSLQRRSVVRLAPDLHTPQSLQTGISVDRQLWRKSSLSVEYQYVRGYDLFRSRNINAPLPDGARPDRTFQNIYQVESTGDRRGHSASATFNGRLWQFSTVAQYTWSHATDNTSDARYLPADNFNLQPEWGPADFDRRHRFSLMASRDWRDGSWRVSPVLKLSSGLPYDITTGFDDNDDSNPNDRPFGVTRNTGRAPGLAQLDVRVTRVFGVGGPINAGDSQAQTVELSMDAFNVLNHTNVSRVVGVQSSPLFGQPLTASKARTLQFAVKYRF